MTAPHAPARFATAVSDRPTDTSRDGASMASTPMHTSGLSRAERAAAAAVVGLVTALGVIGAVNSFTRVADAVRPSFGWLAWSVPVGIDVGIAAFTGLDLVMARLGIRLRWLRLAPWLLVACTVYLNVAGERTAVAALAHGVLPLLWVIAVETAGHVLRSWAGMTDGRSDRLSGRIDRVRWSRWLLAPVSTVRLWRRMVLWETRSYPTALLRERDRVLARTQLEDQYGRIAWRWRASRQQRALYRLGDLVPDQLAPRPDTTPPVANTNPPTIGSARNTKSTATRGPKASGPVRRKTATVEELLPVARRIAAEAAAERTAVTRRLLADRLRSEAGVAVGNERIGHLLGRLRDEAGDPPATTRNIGGQPVALNLEEK